MIPKRKFLKRAREYIDRETGQVGLFNPPFGFDMADIAIFESRPLFIYRLLSAIYDKLGFSTPLPVIPLG